MGEREFASFGKIPRLDHLDMVITEKLDGTNAAVVVTEDGDVYAQSRKRVITADDDNYGFAAWVWAHAGELQKGLGVGRHFGEWWGRGIQRGYALSEKRFSLFNTGRWNDETKPECCHVVPVLHSGHFSPLTIGAVRAELRRLGSEAAPGWFRPEGVMVYIPRLGVYVKHPIDPLPKGEAA